MFTDPKSANTVGVFATWHEDRNSTVNVGHSSVQDKALRLRDYEPVAHFGDDLVIAWAPVSQHDQQLRAHRHLYEVMRPEVRTDVTDSTPLRVNTPKPL